MIHCFAYTFKDQSFTVVQISETDVAKCIFVIRYLVIFVTKASPKLRIIFASYHSMVFFATVHQ